MREAYDTRNMGLKDEINRIINCMHYVAQEIHPEDGYCYERARAMRELLGIGEIVTFCTVQGFSAQKREKKGITDADLMGFKDMLIPKGAAYRGRVVWKYHSVFVYRGMVFAYEMLAPMGYREYSRAIQAINREKVYVYQEKARKRKAR